MSNKLYLMPLGEGAAPRLPRPPRAGETWVGGQNAGHPPARVQILKVAATVVTVRFRSGHKPSKRHSGEHVHFKLPHFRLCFRPA